MCLLKSCWLREETTGAVIPPDQPVAVVGGCSIQQTRVQTVGNALDDAVTSAANEPTTINDPDDVVTSAVITPTIDNGPDVVVTFTAMTSTTVNAPDDAVTCCDLCHYYTNNSQ